LLGLVLKLCEEFLSYKIREIPENLNKHLLLRKNCFRGVVVVVVDDDDDDDRVKIMIFLQSYCDPSANV
jgi:hypothetical protein